MTAWEGKICFSLFIFSWFACIKLRCACATLQSCPFKHQQKWRLQHNSHVCHEFLFFKEEYRTLEIVLDVALEPVSYPLWFWGWIGWGLTFSNWNSRQLINHVLLHLACISSAFYSFWISDECLIRNHHLVLKWFVQPRIFSVPMLLDGLLWKGWMLFWRCVRIIIF